MQSPDFPITQEQEPSNNNAIKLLEIINKNLGRNPEQMHEEVKNPNTD